MPRPRGRSPIFACVAWSMPVVRKRSSPAPLRSITPSAPYRAPVISAAVSTSRCRSASSDSSEVIATLASNRARRRSSPVGIDVTAGQRIAGLRETRAGAPVRPRCRGPSCGAQLRGPKGEVMFKTVLWATDGSGTAARALPFALSLAEEHDAKLVVVHVREIFVGRGGGYPMLADESELRDRIATQVDDLRATGHDARFVVKTATAGHAPAAIAEVAREVGADLIVVGTHGYGRVAGLVLGSVTQGLLHLGVCPVLAVPTGVAAGEPEVELEAAAT